jgi:hypothetical protein
MSLPNLSDWFHKLVPPQPIGTSTTNCGARSLPAQTGISQLLETTVYFLSHSHASTSQAQGTDQITSNHPCSEVNTSGTTHSQDERDHPQCS